MDVAGSYSTGTNWPNTSRGLSGILETFFLEALDFFVCVAKSAEIQVKSSKACTPLVPLEPLPPLPWLPLVHDDPDPSL